jgi:hypothetical protein
MHSFDLCSAHVRTLEIVGFLEIRVSIVCEEFRVYIWREMVWKVYMGNNRHEPKINTRSEICEMFSFHCI